jgi:ubiquinone biosynthesis protein UbiJ
LLNQSLSAAVNHLLEAEAWARDRLRPHRGKNAIIRVASFEFKFQIDDSGLIAAAAGADPVAEPALEVRLAAASLLAALRGEESAMKSAEIRGDADFAAAVLFLVKNLRWDFEEDLSHLVGDIAAHRLVAEAKSLRAWERDARGRLAAGLGQYLTRESKNLAATADVDAFVADIDRLRDDTARLEKRMQRLAAIPGSGRKAPPKR